MFTFNSLFIFHRRAIVVPLHSHAPKSISIISYPNPKYPKIIRHSPSDKTQQNQYKTHYSPYPKNTTKTTQNHLILLTYPQKSQQNPTKTPNTTHITKTNHKNNTTIHPKYHSPTLLQTHTNLNKFL